MPSAFPQPETQALPWLRSQTRGLRGGSQATATATAMATSPRSQLATSPRSQLANGKARGPGGPPLTASTGSWLCCPPLLPQTRFWGTRPQNRRDTALPERHSAMSTRRPRSLTPGRGGSSVVINRDPQGVSELWTLDAFSEQSSRVCPQWKGTVLKCVFLCICVSKEGRLEACGAATAIE